MLTVLRLSDFVMCRRLGGGGSISQLWNTVGRCNLENLHLIHNTYCYKLEKGLQIAQYLY